jgi:hypothetical protein
MATFTVSTNDNYSNLSGIINDDDITIDSDIASLRGLDYSHVEVTFEELQ